MSAIRPKEINSPCLTCIRGPDPERCDNKGCTPWRRWFAGRWEYLRQQYRVRENGELSTGERHPAHGNADTCESCLCPREMCRVPCRLRIAWENRKGEMQ